MSLSAGPDRGTAGTFQAHGWMAVRLFLVVPAAGRQSLEPQEPASGRHYPGRYRIGRSRTERQPAPRKCRQRIGTSAASRRYNAGNCLPKAASFGAS